MRGIFLPLALSNGEAEGLGCGAPRAGAEPRPPRQGRVCTHEKAALPSSTSLPLAPGPAFPQRLTAMHMSRPHLFRK